MLFPAPITPWYLASPILPAAPAIAEFGAETANSTLLHDIYAPAICVVTGFSIAHGSTASGNLDVGIYDANGNRLIHTGITAASHASGTQTINLATPYLLPAGRYFLALWVDNNSDTYFNCTLGSTAFSPAFANALVGQTPAAGGLLATFTAMGGTTASAILVPFLAHLQGTGF